MFVSVNLLADRIIELVSFQLSQFVGSLFLLAFALSAAWLPAQSAGLAVPGVVWQIRGQWRIAGKAELIRIGDAIQPGTLLQPDGLSAAHSIVVLLPDGQRLIYECFSQEDCARGFRVPSLIREPDVLAVDLLIHVRSELMRERVKSPASDGEKHQFLPRDEIVAARGANGRIEVGGLAARLPNGRYTCDLRPIDSVRPSHERLALEKSSPTIILSVPATGLYLATITDEMNTPRINLFVAAVDQAVATSFSQSFLDAKALIGKWSRDYGWSTHDVQWAYLKSLVLDRDLPGSALAQFQSTVIARPAVDKSNTIAVTAEPVFFPRAGTLEGTSAIAMRCDTPDAVMHYTLDGSQPTANSQVYTAPIVLKEGIMTIKSFASVAGKKDSAVVTGTFRSGQP